MTFGLACLYLDWRWVLTALLSFLFLLFVTVTGVPAATLVMIIARPAVDSFVYLPIGPLTLGQVWAIILMLLVLYGLATRQMGAPSLKQDAPVLVFICFALIALVRTPSLAGLIDYTRFMTWLLLVPVLGSVSARYPFRETTILRCGQLLLVGSIAAAWLAFILNQYGIAYYAGELDPKGQGPHGLSLLVVLSLVFVASLAGRSISLIVGLTVAGLAVVLGSFVRSTSIAGLVMSIAALWILAPRRRLRLYGSLSVCLALVLVVALPYAPMFLGRFSDLSLLWTPDYSEAGSGRIAIWMTHLSSLNARGLAGWIFGLGAEGSRQAVEMKLGVPFFAHSDPLEFLVAGGLPMLLSYLSVLFWLMRWALAAARSNDLQVSKFGRLTVVGVLAYALVSFVNGAFFYQASVALSLSLAYCRATTIRRAVSVKFSVDSTNSSDQKSAPY